MGHNNFARRRRRRDVVNVDMCSVMMSKMSTMVVVVVIMVVMFIMAVIVVTIAVVVHVRDMMVVCVREMVRVMVGHTMCHISSMSSMICLMVLHTCPSLQRKKGVT